MKRIVLSCNFLDVVEYDLVYQITLLRYARKIIILVLVLEKKKNNILSSNVITVNKNNGIFF